MIYGSVCSGIEAATVAWEPLGWQPVFFSEIENFPCKVLEHHYPHVPNLGNLNNFEEWNIDGTVDVICGGTPCQAFSVAGLRKGLDDERGNLSLQFVRLLDRIKPRWFLWENVPGVLTSNGGKDFASIVGAFHEIGYCFSWRILDAQFFGVPQRRRRVFIVGRIGNDWRPSAAVLFESDSVSWCTSASGKTWEGIAPPTQERTRSNVQHGASMISEPIYTPKVVGTLTCSDLVNGPNSSSVGAGLYIPVKPYRISSDKSNAMLSSNPNSGIGEANISRTLDTTIPCPSKGQGDIAIVQSNYNDRVFPTLLSSAAGTSRAGAPNGIEAEMYIPNDTKVRRLTPVECERLQGFPDNYTNIPWRGKETSTDGPRYKAIGNSMAVPVMRWIGERIQKVQDILDGK